MATYNVQRGKHATLGAATVDTVNFARSGNILRVANHDASAAIYFTYDAAVPTVAGDDTYFVAPGTSVIVEMGVPFVRCDLISSATPLYSAEIF